MVLNLDIDADLVASAMEYADGRSAKEIVEEALRCFGRRQRLREAISLRGSIPAEDIGGAQSLGRIA